MSEIKIHIFHIGKVCVAPELPFGGEHYSALKASGVLDRQIRSLGLAAAVFYESGCCRKQCGHRRAARGAGRRACRLGRGAALAS